MEWTTVIVIAALIATVLIFRAASFVKPDKARALLGQGAMVIDVREPDEYAAGHATGAVNIPLSELSSRIEASVPDKSRPLLFHCQSGGRSAMAARTLRKMGYTNAHNLGSLGRARSIAGR